MIKTIFFIDPLTKERINLKYESNPYNCFVSDDRVYSMMPSMEERDWVIKKDSEIKYRWKRDRIYVDTDEDIS